DRAGLATIACDVVRIEPVEAGIAVVGALLLRHQQREAVMLRKCRPSCTDVVAGRGLAAAMQYDDERARLLQLRRHEREHAQVTRIGAESGDLRQRAAQAGASRGFGETLTVQLWQTS